jgi:DNA (cytosine-5)-methyltransferase 1
VGTLCADTHPGAYSGQDAYSGRLVPHPVQPYTLAIRGREGGATLEARQDGVSNAILTPTGGRSGVGVGAVAFAVGADCYNGALTGDVAATMGTPGSSVNASDPTVLTQAVAFSIMPMHAAFCATGEVFHTLRADGFDASEDGTGRGAGAVAYAPISFGAQMSEPQTDVDLVQTLQAKNPMAVASALQVRRLTPTECERLQGFPDGWTAIPYRGKPASDGPRYKALGNSMAIPVVSWIGRQIEIAESGLT